MTRAGNATRPQRPEPAGTTGRTAPADTTDRTALADTTGRTASTGTTSRMAPTGTGHSTNRVAPVNAEEGRPVTPAPENGDAR